MYSRQLFVLPTPSSTPFVYVIPQFIGRAHLASDEILERTEKERVDLDPAEAVLRQRTRNAAPGRSGSGRGAKSRRRRGEREQNPISVDTEDRTDDQNGKTSLSFGLPPLRELYEAATLLKDQSLSDIHTGSRKSSRRDRFSTTLHGRGGDLIYEDDAKMTLGSIQDDYSGPLLRNFVESWIASATSSGGYGNIVGKRNASVVEVEYLV